MKIGIIGVTGRIGAILLKLIGIDKNLTFSGGISRKSSGNDLKNVAENSDVLIDFSSPDFTIVAIEAAVDAQTPFITGTTGLSEEHFKKIDDFSKNIPILRSDNFSMGIQVMALLLKQCNGLLRGNCQNGFDVNIIDKHHNRKKDSPSGTALLLAKQIAGDVSISSIRAGNIFGDHICDFVGENEMLTISHRAFNRELFADGALKCARWIVGKNPGKYTVLDCLGVSDRHDY